MTIQITTCNSVAPQCTFGPITMGKTYLASAYLDHHAAAIDRLTLEQKQLRLGAIEGAKEITLDSVSGLLAGLLGEIEEAGDLASLRASEAAKAALRGTLGLSEYMIASGVSRRVTALIRGRNRFSETALVWALAVHLEIAGDLSAYFACDGTAWPEVHGDDAAKFAATMQRVEILWRFPERDIAKLLSALNAHLLAQAELSETEEKN